MAGEAKTRRTPVSEKPARSRRRVGFGGMSGRDVVGVMIGLLGIIAFGLGFVFALALSNFEIRTLQDIERSEQLRGAILVAARIPHPRAAADPLHAPVMERASPVRIERQRPRQEPRRLSPHRREPGRMPSAPGHAQHSQSTAGP